MREGRDQAEKLGIEADLDGMFTRRGMGPSICASCERNLINVTGMPADYHVWRKMPKVKEPSQRIARYGQGFSRILNTLQEDNSQSLLNDLSSNMILPAGTKHQHHHNQSLELNNDSSAYPIN